jgi:hypothetical protein
MNAAHRATRVPNWVWALGFGSISAGTYYYVVSKVSANDLSQQLEAEAARQDAAAAAAAAPRK